MRRTWTNTNSQYPQVPYDLIKEMLVALSVIGVIVLVLAGIFSTPDVPALTAKQVVQQDPKLLIQTALDDLSLQDAISTYGPPYNHTPNAAQHLGPISPESWAGVQIPVNSAQDNVIGPLTRFLPIAPSLEAPLTAWNHATRSTQIHWADTVSNALNKAKITNGKLILPGNMTTDYGPVPQLINAYLALARTGLLESAIDGATGPMPAMNRTKSLLLFQATPDEQYANQLDMTGNQWGIIKETGNYPGAVWLWYYTLLYQIPPFSTSSSADLLVVLTVGIVTVLLMLTPFIPVVRSIPRWIGIYKLIWRRYYREYGNGRREKSHETT
ncbi:hypothetical protein [Ferroacidibacillus organovorans]|uniref:Cytochrome B6 n=1 Tax=Ferroacidibacillus organovorans TaxID=1765683 RepID=A0A853KDJ2_9BACL|nr:hypothetical protein [Ferroacidibacillus organovorans]KYP82121.1 hypothetical protein AYJ22_00245 [Ferroacidibacillus organovorans]OAG94404.1 hypothetical protein AYW79_05135 [Ferroacidibacillus organovorans]